MDLAEEPWRRTWSAEDEVISSGGSSVTGKYAVMSGGNRAAPGKGRTGKVRPGSPSRKEKVEISRTNTWEWSGKA